MTIFELESYPEIIKLWVEEQRKLEPGFTFQMLAQTCGIQKTYLSKVLNQQADLSQDQLFSICATLKKPIVEQEYLSLLLERQRCANPIRRRQLQLKIETLREEQTKIINRIGNQVEPVRGIRGYHENPRHQIIHMALLIERYRNSLKRLARDFLYSEEEIESTLSLLADNGIIHRTEDEIRVLKDFVHLSDTDPLTPLNHYLARIATAQKIQATGSENGFHLTACFTADQKTRQLLQEKILELLGWVQPLVKNSENDHVYQINFDLFAWNATDQEKKD